VQRCAVEAVVEIPGQSVRFYSVHLSHVSSGQRVPQIRQLLDYVRAAPLDGAAWDYVGTNDNWEENRYDVTPPEPAIVMGDFNLTPAFPEYTLLAGELHTWRGTRLVPHDGLFDAWVLAGNAEQEGTSYATKEGEPARLDHVFVTPDLRTCVRKMWAETEVIASDHYPVFVEMDLGTSPGL
jgi:endonuclease/exonuclease/phosphatase family metal-dependent hydrolase